MDRERVNAFGKLAGKCLIDHTMTLDPALPAERLRYDIHPEMAFSARPMTGMSLVPVRFVDHVKAHGRKRGSKLLGDLVPGLHEI